MSRQYLVAGKAISAVLSGKSFKSYCQTVKLGKVDYAIACETLKKLDTLRYLLCGISMDLDSEDFGCDVGVFLAMSYDLLFGSKKIQGGGKVKRIVMQHSEKLKKALADLLQDHLGASDASNLTPSYIHESSNLPKYVRINTLLIDDESGFQMIKSACPSAQRDSLIPFLVRMDSTERSLGEHDMVKKGVLIIQDKASCFPSQILYDEWKQRGPTLDRKGDLIDACASPGNKTSHLASLVYKDDHYADQTIFAFDKDAERAKLLLNRLKMAAANMVVVERADFLLLEQSNSKYSDVEYILLDPSCSGSGIARNWERVIEKEIRNKIGNLKLAAQGIKEKPNDQVIQSRLERLQRFQISAITKAMQFPSVHTIVYSTCSIHQDENEDVVSAILSSHDDWELKSPERFCTWPRRGFLHEKLSPEQSAHLIRCEPSDGLNGFFVALFVKKGRPKAQQHDKVVVNTELRESFTLSEVQLNKLNESIHKEPILRTQVREEKQNRKRKGVFWCGEHERPKHVKRKRGWSLLSSIKYFSHK